MAPAHDGEIAPRYTIEKALLSQFRKFFNALFDFHESFGPDLVELRPDSTDLKDIDQP